MSVKKGDILWADEYALAEYVKDVVRESGYADSILVSAYDAGEVEISTNPWGEKLIVETTEDEYSIDNAIEEMIDLVDEHMDEDPGR